MTMVNKAVRSIDDNEIPHTSFEVILVPRKKWENAFSINEFVERIDFSYGITQAAAVLTIELSYSTELSDSELIREGDYVLLFGYVLENGEFKFKELYRNIIIEVTRRTNQYTSLTIEAYDVLLYAQNNVMSFILPPATLYTRCKLIAESFGIPFNTDNLDSTEILPKRVVRRLTVWETLLDAILWTNELGTEKFIPRVIEGVLYVSRRKIPNEIWVLEQGSNVYEVERKRSILDMRNLIIVRGSKKVLDATDGLAEPIDPEDQLDPVLAVRSDQTSIDAYGVFSEELSSSYIDDENKATIFAENRLIRKSFVQETVTVRCTNINGITWGDPIFVYEQATETINVYFVVSGKHSIDATGATMTLVLSLEDRFDLMQASIEKISQLKNSVIGKIIEGLTGKLPTLNNSPTVTQEPVTGIGDNLQFLNLPFLGNYSITRRYGENKAYYAPQGYPDGHPAIDYGLPNQTPVLAAASGKVIFTGESATFPGRGKSVIIRHSTGYDTLYSHLDSVLVSVNSTVIQGQQIALSGFSGTVDPVGIDGAHLHFGLRSNSVPESATASKEQALKTDHPDWNNRGFVNPVPFIR